jgi:hypothetical protein
MQSIEEIVEEAFRAVDWYGLQSSEGFAAYRQVMDLIEFGAITTSEVEAIWGKVTQ